MLKTKKNTGLGVKRPERMESMATLQGIVKAKKEGEKQNKCRWWYRRVS